MKSSNVMNELMNKNVQKFIKEYGVKSDNTIIEGIQKLILRWCGVGNEDINNVPQKSLDIFISMMEKDIAIPLQL